VIFVDRFGNLISNISGRDLERRPTAPTRVMIGSENVVKLVGTYADAEPGSLVALIGSGGMLEIAAVGGDAARRLKAGPGTPVLVS
jgi:S-adenosylmethionine hydrolase